MNCKTINLKKNSKGQEVKELQEYLKYLGLYKAQTDAEYGEKTEKAVKTLQKQYNLKQDGNYGPITCNKTGINGQDISNTIQAITVETFENITERYNKFKKEKKREPGICYINKENKYRYITNKKYREMLTNYNNYITKNKKKPKICYINKPVQEIKTKNTVLEQFSDAVGIKVKTIQEAYNSIKKRGYICYNNDIYNQKTAINRLKNKKGLNCSDSSQILYEVGKAMGYNIRYVHIKCKSGMGHIQLEVKLDGKWKRFDTSAALKNGSAFGTLWCENGKVIGYNPGWLLTDDGKT